ncbi:MAG: molybdate ABC transporter substrate-binding protein [Chloroflexi bacterium]|nr:molybdate ABC transporter substrate-binding protein [Chloroflexota bacterium]
MRRLAALAILASLLPLTAGCGSGDASITVFAASSLTDAFREAGAAYEAAHPGTKVAFSFASSQALATQVDEGAPADVFASASEEPMDALAKAGKAAAPTVFATNALAVAVAKGVNIDSLDDLARPGLRLVIAAEDVPAGRYTRDMLTKATAVYGPGFATRVLANVRSEEPNVRAVLTKVQLGEADAGIVYESDLSGGPADVARVSVPAAVNVVARYPVAVVSASKHREAARCFIDFLLGDEGQAILRRHGFGGPG